MKISFALLTAALLLAALPAHAQSIAKPGQECDPKMLQLGPDLECSSPMGDVHLSVTEWGNCTPQGNVDPKSIGHDTMGNDINPNMLSIKYDLFRTHMDFIAGANVSMLMPESATFKDGKNKFTVTITKKVESLFGYPEENEFVASFVETNSSGQQVSAGPMACSLLF